MFGDHYSVAFCVCIVRIARVTYRNWLDCCRIFCGTWNVNGRHAPSSLEAFLLEYNVEGEELPPPTPDIFAVAFQVRELN